MNKKVLEKSRGITLIALVITIIVLLILAGISISMLSGENGLLKRVAEAKEKTDEATNQEDLALKYMEAQLKDAWSGNVATSFADGDGTKERPFKISNAEELAYFASLVNGGKDFTGEYVEIIDNINLGNKEFTPIGFGASQDDLHDNYDNFWDFAKRFNGTLDGNDYVITGIQISSEEIKKRGVGVGLIGVLYKDGVVKNIILGQGIIDGYYRVGGIVGYSEGGSVDNCKNNSSVIGETTSIGGIIGEMVSGTVRKCINNGNIVSENQTPGGIVGLLKVSGSIIDCVNNGKIKVEGMHAGGIVGALRASDGEESIQRCINNGKVTAMNQGAGGIAGKQESGTISDCINNAEIYAELIDTGGIVGWSKKCESITRCINNGKITAGLYNARRHSWIVI